MKNRGEQSRKEYNPRRETVENELQAAKNILGWLGVDNLSNIEAFNLRKDIESLFKERERQIIG